MPRKNYSKKPTKQPPFSAGGGCSGKVRYKSKQDAEAVIADQKNLHPELHIRTYQCMQCGGWHLTRKLI